MTKVSNNQNSGANQNSGVTDIDNLPSVASESTTTEQAASPGKTLFVGDSYTYGRFDPVRTYGTNLVHDLNGNAQPGSFDQEGVNGKGKPNGEGGPFGGIPAIFQSFANQQGLNAHTTIAARGATTLSQQEAASRGGYGANLAGNYQTVFGQDKTDAGLNPGTNTSKGATPSGELEQGLQGLKGLNPQARLIANENPAPPDSLHGHTAQQITGENHDNTNAAAKQAGASGVAPVGDAFQNAINDGIASDLPPQKGKALDASGNAVLKPHKAGENPNIDPRNGKIQLYAQDDHHPSAAGAYLSGLVQYGKATGIDPRTVDPQHETSRGLGVPDSVADKLKKVAAQTLISEGTTLHQPPVV